jgi:hypothetical protein
LQSNKTIDNTGQIFYNKYIGKLGNQMKRICFILMMLMAVPGTAAGLQQLIDSFKKPPTSQPAPQPPAPPQAPKSPTGK